MYDDKHLYIGAHVSDPFPMRSTIDPCNGCGVGWKGGGIQVRICVDPSLPWPIEAQSDLLRGSLERLKATDRNESLIHLTLWHFAAMQTNCLHIARGMDFHGQQVNPVGYRGVFRKDPNSLVTPLNMPFHGAS